MKKLWYAAAVWLPWLMNAQSPPYPVVDADFNPGMKTETGCLPKQGDYCNKPVILTKYTGESGVTASKVSETAFKIMIKRAFIDADEETSIAGKAFKDIAAGEQVYFPAAASIVIDAQSLKNLNISAANNTIYPANYPVAITADLVTITFTLATAR